MWNYKTMMMRKMPWFPILLIVLFIATLIFGNGGWTTYRNEKYGFELKYPSDWKLVGSKDHAGFSGFSDEEIIGFVAPELKNKYCNLESEYQRLALNYKTYNPYPRHEADSKIYTLIRGCSIQIEIQDNTDGLNIKEFLKRNYLPYASNARPLGNDMTNAIDSLMILGNLEAESTRTNRGFLKFLGGYAGDTLMSDISDAEQFIFRTKTHMVFVTKKIKPRINGENLSKQLFGRMIASIKLL